MHETAQYSNQGTGRLPMVGSVRGLSSPNVFHLLMEPMKNTFQKALAANLPLIREIALLFHPTLTPQQLARLKVEFKYDWVCIRSNQVSIGIDITHGFWGEGITLQNFQDLIDNNQLRVKAWRFVDDSLSRSALDEKRLGNNSPDIHALVTKAGIPMPTAEEMFDYYYED